MDDGGLFCCMDIVSFFVWDEPGMAVMMSKHGVDVLQTFTLML